MQKQPINPEFYKITMRFVKATTEIIVSKVKNGHQLPQRKIEKHRMINDYSCTTDQVVECDPDRLISSIKDESQRLSEYNACVNFMKKDPVIGAHLDCHIGTWNFHKGITAWDCLRLFIIRQVPKINENPEFNREAFNKVYFDLEFFFYNDCIPTIAKSPMINFTSDEEILEIDDTIRIRKLDKLGKALFLDEFGTYSETCQYLQVTHLFEFEYPTKKVFGIVNIDKPDVPLVDPHKVIVNFVTALRLFKPGMVDIKTYKPNFLIEQPWNHHSQISFGLLDEFWGEPYMLRADELKQFQTLWEKVKRANLQTVAISRLNNTYRLSTLEEKLIDVIVGLESLFLNTAKGTKKLLLASKCASFIAQSDSQEAVEKEIIRAYELRNEVIHGMELDLSMKAEIAVAYSNTQQYLRQAIIKSL